MKFKLLIALASITLLLSACTKEEVKEPVKEPAEEVVSPKEPDNTEMPKVEEKPDPVVERVYLNEGEVYKGEGKFLDVVLDEYSAENKVFSVYYIGGEDIPDTVMEYKLIEERGLGEKNPVVEGKFDFKDDFGQIILNCDEVCDDLPESISIDFVEAMPYSERFYVEEIILKRAE